VDPVIGRDAEIRRVIQVLSRRTKNNPVLIGEPGVGKTAIVEGLAQRIVAGDVPESLRDKRLVSLDLGGMVAGAQYRGQFEERLKSVLEDIKSSNGQVITFLDELHTVVGAGKAEGSMDAGNMLKPMLARGELRMVGATTLDEYRERIEKEPAPASAQRLERLRKELADKREQLTALSERWRNEKEHIARISTVKERLEALRGEAERAERDLDLGKASELRYGRIPALERELAVAEAELAVLQANGAMLKEEVGVDDIAAVVASWTGIPAGRMMEGETAKLLRMEESLQARVIGQAEAVMAVSDAVRRARAGIADPDRPTGSF